ncbi:MAG: hypothetical protein QOD53_787 [Thermoleophilaceae bacterium]|jgi:hypothetical protein|nr:hypothetical protein [Thermoleophilaceae bacterium]
MSGRGIRRIVLALVAALALAALALPAGALAKKKKHKTGGKAPVTRIETPVKSEAPSSKRVKESFVRLRAPLPADAGPRPPACDWITYLRLRDAHGPRKASKADAVFVTMPGIFAGAGMLDQFARNVVRVAAKHKRHVEVWTLDRRANCAEDHVGVDAARQARDYRVALNYYYHGAIVQGHRFAGFKSEQDASYLKAVGLGQTVRDEYTVITRGMPAKLRTKKVFCGGHSLGGPLTTAFANWDFDGNPNTTADAGYNQCAGYFALDTRLDLAVGSSGGGGSSSIGIANALAAGSGGSPYVNAAPFTPETIQAVMPTAEAAYFEPQARSQVIDMLPDDANFKVTFRTLYSRDAANAATQIPSVRDFRTTNEVALGSVFDDNSAPITILRASLGTYAGGPVAQKSWPAPYGSTNTPGGLVDGRNLMIPTAAKGPLYGWWKYNQFGKPGTPVQMDDSGMPFTSAASEITDLRQFARSVFEAPADFVEQYFPTRLLAEDESAGQGDRSGDLQNLRYDGIPKHPSFYADAEHGIEDGAAAPPKGPGPSAWIKLPGYDHIDVATAAQRQNNGKPEAESTGLWKFAAKVLGPKKKHHKHKHHK